MDIEEVILHVERLGKKIIKQADMIESLKCCGNCGDSSCKEELEPAKYTCWQPIN